MVCPAVAELGAAECAGLATPPFAAGPRGKIGDGVSSHTGQVHQLVIG